MGVVRNRASSHVMERFRQRDRQKLRWWRDSDRQTDRSSCHRKIQTERQTLMWWRDSDRQTEVHARERFRQTDRQKLM